MVGMAGRVDGGIGGRRCGGGEDVGVEYGGIF